MDYSEIAKDIRRKVLEMVYKSNSAHIGSSLSYIDILVVLYFKILSIDPNNPKKEDRDRFILSKGHAAAGLYATLSKRGFFSENLLDDYYKDGKKMAGHSTRESVEGVEVSTGSLGHGLSMANGMALTKKGRVFVVLSDGECQEGSNWEAALFASHHKLDNLIVIIDYNKIQSFGRIKDVMGLEPLAKKWESFGWSVKEINGHNFKDIENVFSDIPFEKSRPSLVIAHTVKGKGISFLEDKLISHYKIFSKEEYEQALKELL